MSLIQGIKNTLSNNRGKIGLVAGAGTAVGAQQYLSKEHPALYNQAEYNIMAKGNNLLSPITGNQEISQDIQNKVNGYYNHLQENPKSILGIDRPVLPGDDAYTLSQGVQTVTNTFDKVKNNVKDFGNSIQDVVESSVGSSINPASPAITIQIKDMLLEGYTYEEILEAINLKKAAAAAAIGATIASPFVVGPATKIMNKPSKLEQPGSLGQKTVESRLTKLGVVQPAKQLEAGELNKYFNSKQ